MRCCPKCGHIFIDGSKYDWSSVDWAQTNRAIADEMGCTAATVWRYRSDLRIPKFRPPVVPRVPKVRVPPKSKYAWDSVDWNERDTDIAGRLGCTKERARQVRKQRGFPSPYRHQTGFGLALRRGEVDLTPAPVKELAARWGIPPDSADRYGRMVGCRIMQDRKSPMWKLVNWDLPNVDLWPIWVPHLNHNCANVKLHNERQHPPCWIYHNAGQMRSFRARRQDFKWHRLIEQEQAKAQDYFAQNGEAKGATDGAPALR